MRKTRGVTKKRGIENPASRSAAGQVSLSPRVLLGALKMGVVARAGACVLNLSYLALFLIAGYAAYQIRIYAIKTYGYVIHEFDPWFNFRATKYLAEHGWHEFFHWFDYKVWYPLGRPVGTTIYPGMQITSVCIWKALGWAARVSHLPKLALSLNDVCCLVPAWFGVSASWALGLLTAECSGSWSAGAMASLIMSVIPAHIMRSGKLHTQVF